MCRRFAHAVTSGSAGEGRRKRSVVSGRQAGWRELNLGATEENGDRTDGRRGAAESLVGRAWQIRARLGRVVWACLGYDF